MPWNAVPPGAGFLRVYSAGFDLGFLTSLPGVELCALARRGQRVAAVGTARAQALADGVPATQPAAGLGGTDGCLLVLDAGR